MTQIQFLRLLEAIKSQQKDATTINRAAAAWEELTPERKTNLLNASPHARLWFAGYTANKPLTEDATP